MALNHSRYPPTFPDNVTTNRQPVAIVLKVVLWAGKQLCNQYIKYYVALQHWDILCSGPLWNFTYNKGQDYIYVKGEYQGTM